MVALDGVYTRDGETLRFHEVSAPSSADVQRLLDVIVGGCCAALCTTVCSSVMRSSALGKAHREADHHRPTAPMTADCMAISIPFAMRTNAIDLSVCRHCGGRLRVIAGADFRMSRDRM